MSGATYDAGALIAAQRDDRRTWALHDELLANDVIPVVPAPVLAQAQVSVAMGGGSQLARTQADLVLLSENLDHLRRGFVLARRSLRIIRQNLLWSFAYNIVALPLAMSGLITPWMAGIGMSGSSLLVVLNSLRLQRPTESG